MDSIFHEISGNTNGSMSGLAIDMADIPKAMAFPVFGLLVGLLIAIFISYRKPREYTRINRLHIEEEVVTVNKRNIVFTVAALDWDVSRSDTDPIDDSGSGDRILQSCILRVHLRWKEADGLINEGMRMMAFVGFVMIAANGFAAVLQETGHIVTLVECDKHCTG